MAFCGSTFRQNNYLFHNRNALVHRAHSVMEYRCKNKIKTFTQRVQSSDLNIVKNVQYRLKRELQCNLKDSTDEACLTFTV